MKTYLLPENGTFYKANLHCHTTVSDGKMTPEEVKAHYMAQGYSVVAFTDHCVLIPHPELASEDFLPLNGYETELISRGPEVTGRKKHCHLCFVSLDENNVTMPYFSPKSIWGNGKKYLETIKYNGDEVFETWYHDPEITNRVIRLAREGGFFVTYNHPIWSAEHFEDYSQYTGMNAMEILNYGCWEAGYQEYNPGIYDELLRKGEHIFALATDDNHNVRDTCGGWTMIKAESLTYAAVADALKNGRFYASWGPEIQELWFEDGKVHIKTSPARRIVCNFQNYRAKTCRGTDGQPITEASFEIQPGDGYFRITVIDEQHRCADTNAYFTDQLFD